MFPKNTFANEFRLRLGIWQRGGVGIERGLTTIGIWVFLRAVMGKTHADLRVQKIVQRSCSDVQPFQPNLNYDKLNLNPESWYLNPGVKNRAESSKLNPESSGKKQS